MTWGKLQTPEINWSDDGVPSSQVYDDVYYNNENPNSGIEESQVVFIEGIGAPQVWQNTNVFTIIETGFGTGLNFLNTWKLWQKTSSKNARLNFISIENSPLDAEQITKALKPFAELGHLTSQLTAQYPPRQAGFHNLLFDDERVRLTLMFGDIEQILPKLSAKADAWFLDGFAPSKNPQMWSDKLFAQIKTHSSPQAKLATFTAASLVRRGLEHNGFKVTKKSGFGKKRERITAQLNDPIQTDNNKPKSVAIIGAGIAGAMLAYKLKKRGLSVTLLDRHDKPAQETSSNPAALISPKLALGDDPYDRLLSLSYLQAIGYYGSFDELWLSPHGLLSIATGEKSAKYFADISQHYKENLGWGNLFQQKSTGEIKAKWSLNCQFDGLYFPNAGSIDTKKLICQLCDGVNYQQANVSSLVASEGRWQIKAHDDVILEADAVVIACGLNSYGPLNNEQSPLIANRGQLSMVEDNLSDNLADNLPSLSFGNYLTASFEMDGKRQRIIGASHTRMNEGEVAKNNWQKHITTEEDEQLSGLSNLTGQTHTSIDYKTGLRATTIDHMPIVGAVPCADAIKKLPKNRQKTFPAELDQSHRQDGLFIMTGLGARGYQLAPLLSEILTSQILAEANPIDSEILDAIDPARFALRRRRHQKL